MSTYLSFFLIILQCISSVFKGAMLPFFSGSLIMSLLLLLLWTKRVCRALTSEFEFEGRPDGSDLCFRWERRSSWAGLWCRRWWGTGTRVSWGGQQEDTFISCSQWCINTASTGGEKSAKTNEKCCFRLTKQRILILCLTVPSSYIYSCRLFSFFLLFFCSFLSRFCSCIHKIFSNCWVIKMK